jgi:isopentenyl-diphosphate delta-isomerase
LNVLNLFKVNFTKSMTFGSTNIILVNEHDEEIGTGEKLMVHQQGLLHRAFSILIFNKNNELLIHQRTPHKYHSGNLWTNTCCGHPNANEEINDAAHRRLVEEMGFDTPLDFLFKFQYRAEFENGLVENEIDHVFVGNYNETFEVNPEEVADYQWITIEKLLKDVSQNPIKYTFWFKEILKNEQFLLGFLAKNNFRK